MSFSHRTFILCKPVVNAIKKLPFQRELAHGTLQKSLFANFLAQDQLYLKTYAACFLQLANKAPTEFSTHFSTFANATVAAEEAMVSDFFQDFKIEPANAASPATANYTRHLAHTCATEPLAIAYAALVPCFWVFHEVGQHLLKNIITPNPYQHWLNTYISEGCTASVNTAIALLNQLSHTETPETRARMMKAFYTSTVHEWHFWDEAYYQTPTSQCRLFHEKLIKQNSAQQHFVNNIHGGLTHPSI